MIYSKDVYIDDICMEQGKLFELVSLEDYDMVEFIRKYLNSELRKQIDYRSAIESNYLGAELKEEFFKNETVKSGGRHVDILTADYAGEFYARLQGYFNLSSKIILEWYTPDYVMSKAHILSSYDWSIIADKTAWMYGVTCFHNPDEENGYLSNWYLCNFYVDGVSYTSMEQYMMHVKAKLFEDTEIANEIMSTTDVGKIKALGRKVRNFDEYTWKGNKRELVKKGLQEKFKQNPRLMKLLKDTGSSVIVECAVKDKVWGIGLSMKDERRLKPTEWLGDNLLGQLLTEIKYGI